MKIGILNAALPTVQGLEWDPIGTYIAFFESVQAPFDYVGYEIRAGQFPASPDDCDAYVITGSPSGVYDADEWITALSDFVRSAFEAGKKLVGICFGHQLLAHALGGHAKKSEKGRGLGMYAIDLYRTPGWMAQAPSSLPLHYIHQDQVMALPPQATLLGGNEFCPNAMFTIGNQVLGMQGHPEFTQAFMRQVIPLMAETVPAQTYQQAWQSVQQDEPNNKLVATWVVNFLQDA